MASSVATPAVRGRRPPVAELLETARELVARCDDDLLRELPAGVEVFDAHVHLGRDSDGMVADFGELLWTFERYGISRAFAFCLDEPDREPAFKAPNNRTLEHAARSDGCLIPFVRLDLADDPIGEATRCLDRGARGIKLHPRAQAFGLDDGRLAAVFAVAAERRVPILIHGGHGLPPIASHLLALVEAHPGSQLIVAHAGVADMANLARRFAGLEGVFFDTSTWSPIDLLDLFRRVPSEQILYGSDYPYGQQPSSLFGTRRVMSVAGLDEERIHAVLGENAGRIADGKAPLAPAPPAGPAVLSQPLVLARIHQYLSMAAPLLWMQRRDSIGVVDLAVSACDEDDAPELGRIRRMLETARDLWRSVADIEGYAGKRTAARATFQLIQLADILVVTSGGERA